uniref:ribosomal protein S12 n=1 Tax=Choristocarpus tenellus TaxID=116065 RepID=UPI002E75C1F2|nr:ribosomal protein S12 [Choristocarpus tenellus]WBP69805.1 ribosomal protein S12 [Choristocarpus tenellus]
MPSINQLLRKARSLKSSSLEGCPQKRGICLKLFIRSPKKPNSARRRVTRLKLSNKFKLTAYIPGQVNSLQEHSHVLVRGGRVPDLPGVNYHLIRNKLDLAGLGNRKNARSKYGTKKRKLW